MLVYQRVVWVIIILNNQVVQPVQPLTISGWWLTYPSEKYDSQWG